jgi:hypothetical protein
MTKDERTKKDEEFKAGLLAWYGRGPELLSFFTHKEILKNKIAKVIKA